MKIYKKWWFWVAIIAFIGIIAASGGQPDSPTAASSTPTTLNKAIDSPAGLNTTTTTKPTSAPTTTPTTTPKGTVPTTDPTTAKSTTTLAPTTTPIPTTTKAPTTTTTKTPTTTKAASYKDGMYKVGTDIPAGEYVVLAESGYLEVASDSSGKLESIITNDMFEGNRYITVSSGQYLTIKYAQMLPVDKAPVFSTYGEGMYKVGRDIAAGEYKVISNDSLSYIEVSSDSTGSLYSMVTNDIFESSKYITITDGQYIILVGCYIEQ